MNAFIYQADIYCEDCGQFIRERVTKEIGAPSNPDEETSYDSDDFPKGPYRDGGGEADSPQHCGSGNDCVNAISFDDGTKAGAFLENPLTSDGYEYVRNSVNEFLASGRGCEDVVRLWAEYYDIDFPDEDDEDD